MDELFDIQDLKLEVQAELTEIVREFVADLMAPRLIQMMAMQWAQMSPDEKEVIKQQNPREYRQFIRLIGR